MTCLAAVVVFCTTYALILPAITMEKETCPIPEHIHSEACYAQVPSASEKEPSGEEEGGEALSPLPETEFHTHDENCYRAAEPAHTHTEDCYTLERGELLCEEEEREGHTHSAEEGCFDEDEELLCQIEEEPGHQHTDDCYDWEPVLSCELTEREADEEPELICGKEEILPPEPGSDSPRTEEKEEPEDGLSDERTRELICGLEEHTHTSACQSVPAEEETTEEPDETEAAEENEEKSLEERTAAGEEYTVSVRYGEEAGLPEGVAFQTEEISEDAPEYLQYCQQAEEMLAQENPDGQEYIVFVRFLDMQFCLDGQMMEPEGPVEVTAALTDFPDSGETSQIRVIHFGEDGPELLDASVQQEEESTSFTYSQNSFSVVGYVLTDEKPQDMGNAEPEKLPADFYVCVDDQWICAGSAETVWYIDDSVKEQPDTGHDYITAEQAASVLGPYGLKAEDSLSHKIACQRQSGDDAVCREADTADIDGTQVLLLSRSENCAGYNLYYLPNSKDGLPAETAFDDLDKSGNSFYTVQIYNADGELLKSGYVLTGGSFLWEGEETGGTDDWRAVFGDGAEQKLGNTVSLEHITSPVVIFPEPENAEGSVIEEAISSLSVFGSSVIDADEIEDMETGTLIVSNQVKGEGDNQQKFAFTIELLKSENGPSLEGSFSYHIGGDTDATDTIGSGGTIHLESGEEAVIKEIPAGTFYRVTEKTEENYRTTANGVEGNTASGTIQKDAEERAAFVNTPYYILPETGGRGTPPYTAGGLLLMAAGIFLLDREKKRRKEDSASS